MPHIRPQDLGELQLLAARFNETERHFNQRWTDERVDRLEGMSELQDYDSERFDLWLAQSEIAAAMTNVITRMEG
jgi:hypothetical protein